jgi:hypothetical protein
MEQDIFFTEKPIVNKKDSIIINLESDYLSIYNKSKKRLYPRIWEGATFIKKEIIESALISEINFGNSCDSFKSNKIYKECINFYTTNSSIIFDFKSIKKAVDDCLLDTLFEFSFYCFLNRIEYQIKTNNFNYEYGENVVHLRGIDMMCHDNPIVYNDVKEINNMQNKSKTWLRLSNGCAFLLYLTGIYEKSKELKNIIKNNYKESDKLLYKKLTLLLKNSEEWMTKEQVKKIYWAMNQIDKTIYM